MRHAAITGWGKCLPPAVVTNADLSTFLDTSDEWIHSRTGMRERRISHVGLGELAFVAGSRALACAGVPAGALDLVIVGSTLGDEMAPNVASGVQKRLGAGNAAALDLNTACTSFLYGLHRDRARADGRPRDRPRRRRRGPDAVHRLGRPEHRGPLR